MDEPVTFVQQVRLAYEQVVAAIIRPPRTNYNSHHLGPRHFEYLGRAFGREDFNVYNSRGHALACSRWRATESLARMLPTLIFMHGNAYLAARRAFRDLTLQAHLRRSARIEALPQLSVCLSLGIAVVSFDFSGSGISDGCYNWFSLHQHNLILGEYVTLGAMERLDIRAVVQYLRDEGS